MTLSLELYRDQVRRWPAEGRHVLAHYDDASIVVYQAYRPEVARHAVAHRAFGGEAFSYGRMSWIKPNFLWMMYRSGWGTKPNQESVLALRISRAFFDGLLERAVASTFDPVRHRSREAWQAAVAASDVRLQWDPDHDPHGTAQPRRAIQLGLRGETLAAFGRRELLDVDDVSALVAAQRDVLAADAANLRTPSERPYRPKSTAAAANVGLDEWPLE